MKDYTITHVCGLEFTESMRNDAKKFAKQHEEECEFDTNLPNQEILIKEYSGKFADESEPTGECWKLQKGKFTWSWSKKNNK